MGVSQIEDCRYRLPIGLLRVEDWSQMMVTLHISGCLFIAYGGFIKRFRPVSSLSISQHLSVSASWWVQGAGWSQVAVSSFKVRRFQLVARYRFIEVADWSQVGCSFKVPVGC